MRALEAFRDALPDAARDVRLNLQAVLGGSVLTPAQLWGVAIASAIAARSPRLQQALVEAARPHVSDAVVDDAQAAAALMAMNNVYYRFRQMVGNPLYERMPARLRMQRLAQPAGSKADFELVCLAVSAVNGCQTCVKAHEATVTQAGLTPEQVHEAVRIAAVVHAAAVAHEMTGAATAAHSAA